MKKGRVQALCELEKKIFSRKSWLASASAAMTSVVETKKKDAGGKPRCWRDGVVNPGRWSLFGG